MNGPESNIDRLLVARAKVDEELRQFKAAISIMFTDLVGSTEYFDRYGDTAGVGMLHRHVDLGTKAVEVFHGRVIKTIGDSVMAEFPEPVNAVCAAVDLQRQLLALNLKLPERERLQLRVGINHGQAIRSGKDVYGDAVNVAARIVKHTGPAQILVSRSVRNAIGPEAGIQFTGLGKISMKGKAEQEEVFEIVWTEPVAYVKLQSDLTAAFARGELVSSGLSPQDLVHPVTAPASKDSDQGPYPPRKNQIDNCAEKIRLLQAYDDVTRQFSDRVAALNAKIRITPKSRFDLLERAVEDSRLNSEQARIAYERHRADHGC